MTSPHPSSASSLTAVTADRDHAGAAPDDPRTIVSRALSEAFDVQQIDRSSEVMTHLDTADWRLLRAGIDLVWVPASGRAHRVQRWRCTRHPAGRSRRLAGAGRRHPRRSGARARPGSGVDARPAPFATSRAQTTGCAILNSDDKTVARARWWDVRVESPVERRLPARVEVEHFRGYERRGRRDRTPADRGVDPVSRRRDLARRVSGCAGHRSGRDATFRHARRSGRRPGRRRRPAGSPEHRWRPRSTASSADLDTEFLHDFRVSRSGGPARC